MTKPFNQTKATRLDHVKRSLAQGIVDPFFWFTLAEWQISSLAILAKVEATFTPDEQLIIRSSADGEDNIGGSLAGALRSQWAIAPTDVESVRNAVDLVANSFSSQTRNPKPIDQIIIQRYLPNPTLSGVVLTWDLWHERPYYVVNYDLSTTRTDLVTSGRRGATVRLLRNVDKSELSPQLDCLLAVIREIESLFPEEILDIEFALDAEGVVHIFQVRGLAKISRAPSQEVLSRITHAVDALERDLDPLLRASASLPGCNTILSDMADWNPAEMLGEKPGALAVSLYRHLITDSVWNEARASLGYCDVAPASLMLVLGGKPYIDTRVSFNSLLPNVFDPPIRQLLVQNCIDTLAANTALHDKIEFDVALSCYDLNTPDRLEALRDVLSKSDLNNVASKLCHFTNALVSRHESLIAYDLNVLHGLERRNTERAVDNPSISDLVASITNTLASCRTHGIVPFVRLARLAFVGMALLKSLVKKDVLSENTSSAFLRSLKTVATSVHVACAKTATGETAIPDFLAQYGHLRPKTYDITATRYDRVPSDFWLQPGSPMRDRMTSAFTPSGISDIAQAFEIHGLAFAEGLFAFVKRTIESREYAKFVFSKSLSDALESIARLGEHLGLPRESMEHVPVETILSLKPGQSLDPGELNAQFEEVRLSNAAARTLYARLALPPVLRTPSDLRVVPYSETYPNFVSQKVVRGTLCDLSQFQLETPITLRDKIVLLDRADPGYDWIFAQHPLGLITKYGGAGSHMAIRCGEFNLAAAIGCGESTFEELRHAFGAVLDCATGAIGTI